MRLSAFQHQTAEVQSITLGKALAGFLYHFFPLMLSRHHRTKWSKEPRHFTILSCEGQILVENGPSHTNGTSWSLLMLTANCTKGIHIFPLLIVGSFFKFIFTM